jgi:hypothetical protein
MAEASSRSFAAKQLKQKLRLEAAATILFDIPTSLDDPL